MADRLQLKVGGKSYSGWERASIKTSMEAAAGVFRLEVEPAVPERPGGAINWPIKPGQPCDLVYGNRRLIQGHVDRVGMSLNGRRRRYVVSGRDATADLIDCSATNSPDQWQNLDIFEIAAQLADPFGVSVGINVDPGDVFPIFKLQPSETPWAAIERMCRMRGLLAFTPGNGSLLITAPSTTRLDVELAEGKNVLAASGESSMNDRFSEYTVTGQSFGNDQLYGENAAHISGQARDNEVTRFRPKVVLAEGVVSTGASQRRAEWEATIRAARATKASASVSGWRQAEGGLIWEMNRVISCKIPSIAIESDMLISSVELTIENRSSEKATLGLVRPDAYKPQPAIELQTNPYSAFV